MAQHQRQESQAQSTPGRSNPRKSRADIARVSSQVASKRQARVQRTIDSSPKQKRQRLSPQGERLRSFAQTAQRSQARRGASGGRRANTGAAQAGIQANRQSTR